MSKKVKRAIIIVVCVVLAIFLVVLPAITMFLYSTVFGVRYETQPSRMNLVANYPGLQRARYEITSNEGQTVVGYHYYREDRDPKALVVMAHGIGGGGHNSYMDLDDYFTQNGYDTFAYDVTGNDESEGSNVRGLPQGVIDLDYVLDFIESSEDFAGLPIMLFGHSWGGYSVSSVLNEHPEVTAVCAVAGFDRSTDLLEAQGKQMAGPAIYLMLPYLKLYERLKFGEYSTQTAMEGFEKTDAKILIVHSEDDNTVPIIYGYDIYYEVYANDPDFKFIRYTDKGHNAILNLDKNPDLMENAVAFYDSALQGG